MECLAAARAVRVALMAHLPCLAGTAPWVGAEAHMVLFHSRPLSHRGLVLTLGQTLPRKAGSS